MVLLHNTDIDKQLHTAESLEFPEVFNLSQIFFKLYNQAINLYFHVSSQN